MKVTKTFCDICGAESGNAVPTLVQIRVAKGEFYEPDVLDHKVGDACSSCQKKLRHAVEQAIKAVLGAAKS